MTVPEITVKEVDAKRRRGDPITLLDVRDQWEYDLVNIEDATFIPMDTIPVRLAELQKEKETVVYCHKGIRSAAVAAYLLEQGFQNVKNMTGGIHAWALELDPSLPTY